MKINKSKLLLLLILALALFFRLYRLTEIPYGFDGDEAAFGYYGYSLLTNISDEYGNKLPLYFPSIGDYKYPGYAYATVLPTLLFGPGIFAARFMSVISGVLLVYLMFKFVSKFTKNNKLSMTAAFLMAISPYSIMFSRGAYESNFALLLSSVSIYFLTLKKPKFKQAYLFLLFAIYTYSATRIFFLVFIPLLYLINKFVLNKKNEKPIPIIFVILVIITILLSFVDARSRVRATSIGFLDSQYSGSIQEEYVFEDGLNMTNVKVTQSYHNKVSTFGLSFFRRYISHLDFTYLFLEANPSLSKYSIRGFGLFYFFEVATILSALAFFKKYKKSHVLFSVWLVASLVPSSLSIETPNPIRALLVIPPLIYFSSVGLYELINIVNKKFRNIAMLFVSIIVALHVIYFWHQYTVHDVFYRPWNTDGGVTEMIASVKKLEGDFEKVVFTNDPYIFLLLYKRIKPQEFLRTASISEEKLGTWERVDSFDKYVFKMNVNCPKIGKPNVLYVCKGGEVPLNGVLHDVIRFKDSAPAFLLIEFVPYSERPSASLPTGVHYMVETDLAFEEALLGEDENRLW